MIITDGDSQETRELDAALRIGTYGNAHRRRCGWHILHQGCKNILYTKYITCVDKCDKLQTIVGNMKAWIQESLMKEVENEDEYTTYVSLLMVYIIAICSISATNRCVYIFVQIKGDVVVLHQLCRSTGCDRANKC